MEIIFEHLDAIVKTGGYWYSGYDGFNVVRGDQTVYRSNEWLAGMDAELPENVRYLCDTGVTITAETVATLYAIRRREIHLTTTLGDHIAVAIIRNIEVDDDSVVFIGNGAPYRKLIRPNDDKVFISPLGYRPSSFEVSREWLDKHYVGWLPRLNNCRALDYSLHDAVKHMLCKSTIVETCVIPDDLTL